MNNFKYLLRRFSKNMTYGIIFATEEEKPSLYFTVLSVLQ